jgi:hypothetical protein
VKWSSGGGGVRCTVNGRRGLGRSGAWRSGGPMITARERRSRVAAGRRGSAGQGRLKGNGGSERTGDMGWLAGVGRSERTVTLCNYSKLFKWV